MAIAGIVLSLIVIIVSVGNGAWGVYLQLHKQKIAQTSVTTMHANDSVAVLPAGWKLFTPTNKTFTVALPCVPTPTTQSISSVTVSLYKCTDNTHQVEYRVAQTTLPQAISSTAGQTSTILKDTINGVIASNPGSTLVTSQQTTVGPYQAIDYTIKTQAGSYYKFRSIIAGNSIYEIGTLSSSDSPLYYDQFITSLKIGSA